jgi:archaellum component FlaC
MRYKQPVENKLDQLENMLNGFQAQFSNPSFTINIAKDMLSQLKDKVEEIRTLINAEQQD